MDLNKSDAAMLQRIERDVMAELIHQNEALESECHRQEMCAREACAAAKRLRAQLARSENGQRAMRAAVWTLALMMFAVGAATFLHWRAWHS